MIDKKYKRITFTILMGTTMAFFIVVVNSILNIFAGSIFNFNVFLTTWIRNSLIAIPTAYFVVPMITKLTNKIFKD